MLKLSLRYSKKIHEYFQNDSRVGVLSGVFGKGAHIILGQPEDYNLVHLYCIFSEKKTIDSVRYKILANGVLMALTAWVSEQLEGKTWEQTQSITAERMIKVFYLAERYYQDAFLLEQGLNNLRQKWISFSTNKREIVL